MNNDDAALYTFLGIVSLSSGLGFWFGAGTGLVILGFFAFIAAIVQTAKSRRR